MKKIPQFVNEKGSKVEADVAICQLLSLLCYVEKKTEMEKLTCLMHYTTADLLLCFS